jgi:hypothetical protein
MPKNTTPNANQLAAWRAARARNYLSTLSAEALAAMVVELEDDGHVPQFEIDEEWPAAVRHMRIK